MNNSKQELTTKSGKCRIILNTYEVRIDLSDEKRKELKNKSKLAQEITHSIFPIILQVNTIRNVVKKGDTIIMKQRNIVTLKTSITFKNDDDAGTFYNALTAIINEKNAEERRALQNKPLVFEGVMTTMGKSAFEMDSRMRAR